MDQLSMAWNEPGSNGSNKNKDQPDRNASNGPPDLEEVLGNLYKQILALFGLKKGNISGGNRFNGFRNLNNNFFIMFIVGIAIFVYLNFYLLNFT